MLSLHFLLIIMLTAIFGKQVEVQEAAVHEVPKFKRGRIEILDETALTNPNSFDYDFSEDLSKPADMHDLYDQFIEQLPMFHIYKMGTDRGMTQVPVVTRAGDTWFTPTTTSTREQKFTFYLTTAMPPKEKISTTTSVPRTTTRKPTTTTKTTTTVTTTPIPTTKRTTTSRISTTTATTTTKATTSSPRTTSIIRTSRPFPKQPAPVFKTQPSRTTTTSTTTIVPETPAMNRGPIWRKGGVIIDTKTSPQPPTIPRYWTVRGIRVRVTRPPITQTSTTTTASPTTATSRKTTFSPITRAPWWKTTTSNTWVAGPRRPPTFNQNQNWKQPIRKLQETIGHTVAPSHPISGSPSKPVIIHTGKYAGPTFNCRVLNPFTDGERSTEHDTSCKMLYPGLSLDGTCRCFYKVAGRDNHGCATGFIYACRVLGSRSTSV